MTKKQITPVGATTDDFAQFSEEGHAIVETAQWSYPPIGYKSSTAELFVDEKGVKNGSAAVTMTMLAYRQAKYVEVNGAKEYYSIYEKPAFMAGGKVFYHNQAIVGIGGQLFVFGSHRYTVNMFFTNPENGRYRRPEFQVGLFPALKAFVAKVKAEQGVNIPLYAVSFEVKPADKSIMVGTTNKQKVVPLTFNPWFIKTSANEVDLYKELYKSEDLAGWKKEWTFATGEKTAAAPMTTQEAAQVNAGLFGNAESDDGQDGFDLAF